VVADIAKLSVGREEYYTRELATNHDAYLSGHGESAGRWYGAGAATLAVRAVGSWWRVPYHLQLRHHQQGRCVGRWARPCRASGAWSAARRYRRYR
jgi:hypothetical protein